VRHGPRPGGGVAGAVAVGDDDADAEQALAGQVELDGALLVRVLAELLPALAGVAGVPDLDPADAAGADLVDAVVEHGVGGADHLRVLQRAGVAHRRDRRGPGVQAVVHGLGLRVAAGDLRGRRQVRRRARRR